MKNCDAYMKEGGDLKWPADHVFQIPVLANSIQEIPPLPADIRSDGEEIHLPLKYHKVKNNF
jgi:hypothetical protein